MDDEKRRIRVVAPDLWREERMEFAPGTTIADLKEAALPALLGKSEIDSADYYVEYREKEIIDESTTLADLDVPDNGVISIREYDLDHPPPFTG